MLAFLIVASLAGVFAGYGSGLCIVDGNYTGVDNTSWPQVQNPNFGTFFATAYENDTNTVTTTYHANDTLKITIASNGTDKIAGIVGYFADSMQLSGQVLRAGNWLLLDNENYTSTRECSGAVVCSHGPCKGDGFTVFSDVNDSYRPFFDGVSQSELSFEWNFDYFDLRGLVHLKTAHSYVFEMKYPYSGTLYWIIVPDRVRTEAEAQYPTSEQLKAGKKADGRRAPQSGYEAFSGFLPSDSFVVAGLETDTIYTVYYFMEITDPPTVNFEAYVLTGELGNNSTLQLYRTVAGDPVNLRLVPASNPLPTAVQMKQLQTERSAAFTAGPTMLLIALCLWISSSQMLL